MQVTLPKEVVVGVFPHSAIRNKVVVDGKIYMVEGEALLIYQVLDSLKIKPSSEDDETCSYVINDPEAEYWIKIIIEGIKDKRQLARAIGYWCNLLPVASRSDPKKPYVVGEYIKAVFCTTTTNPPSPPFFYSLISTKAFYEERAEVLEDYIWLTEVLGKRMELTAEPVQKFIERLIDEWENCGGSFFLTERGEKMLVESYAIAVSTRLYKIYGDEWRKILAMALFDFLLDGKRHRIIKVLYDELEEMRRPKCP